MLVYLTPCPPLRKQEMGNRLATQRGFANRFNLGEVVVPPNSGTFTSKNAAVFDGVTEAVRDATFRLLLVAPLHTFHTTVPQSPA